MSKTQSAMIGGGIGAVLGGGLGAFLAGSKARGAGFLLGALGGAAGGSATGYTLGKDDEPSKGAKLNCPAGTYGPPGGPCVPFEPGKLPGAATLPRTCGKGTTWVPNPLDPSGTCIPTAVSALDQAMQNPQQNAQMGTTSARRKRHR